jgi:Arabinose efflux permease
MTKNSMYIQVLLLSIAQAFFQIVSIMVMTIGGLAGKKIAQIPELATLPIATMFLGTAILTFPASIWMSKVGRRSGFIIGSIAGVMGAIVSLFGILYDSLLCYSIGTFLIGSFQAFAQFYRFAASEVATPDFRPKAIALTMAGGIIAAFSGPYLARLGGPLLNTEYTGSFLIMAVIAIVSAILLIGLKIPNHVELEGNNVKNRPLYKIILQPAYMVALFSAATGYGIMVLAMTTTPLAMLNIHGLDAVALVIQFHVLGMFVPSFFTGTLIARFGTLPIMLFGVFFSIGYVVVSATSTSFISFLIALTLIGIGWNFLFIGGTSLLVKTYSASEKGKAQATNDMSIFIINLLCSFSAAGLLNFLGWKWMNLALLPWLVICACLIIWLSIKGNKFSS